MRKNGSGYYAVKQCSDARHLKGDWDGKQPAMNAEVGLAVNVVGTGKHVTAHILKKG